MHTWGIDLSGSLQGAGGVGGLLATTRFQENEGQSYYPTYDGNGNVSEYLDATGAVAAHFEYDPFGNTLVNTDTGNQFAYRFSIKPQWKLAIPSVASSFHVQLMGVYGCCVCESNGAGGFDYKWSSFSTYNDNIKGQIGMNLHGSGVWRMPGDYPQSVKDLRAAEEQALKIIAAKCKRSGGEDE